MSALLARVTMTTSVARELVISITARCTTRLPCFTTTSSPRQRPLTTNFTFKTSGEMALALRWTSDYVKSAKDRRKAESPIVLTVGSDDTPTRRVIARMGDGLSCLDKENSDGVNFASICGSIFLCERFWLIEIGTVDRNSSYVEALREDVFIQSSRHQRKRIPIANGSFPSGAQIFIPLNFGDEIHCGEGSDRQDGQYFRVEEVASPRAQVLATQTTGIEQMVPATASPVESRHTPSGSDEAMIDVESTETGTVSGTAVDMVLDTPKKDSRSGSERLFRMDTGMSALEDSFAGSILEQRLPAQQNDSFMESAPASIVPAFLIPENKTPTPTIIRTRHLSPELTGGEPSPSAEEVDEDPTRSEQSSLPEAFTVERNKRSSKLRTYTKKRQSESPEVPVKENELPGSTESPSRTAQKAKRKPVQEPAPARSKKARTSVDSQEPKRGRGKPKSKLIAVELADSEEEREAAEEFEVRSVAESRDGSRGPSVAETDDESIQQNAQKAVSTPSSYATAAPSPPEEKPVPKRTRKSAADPKTPKAKPPPKSRTPASTRKPAKPPTPSPLHEFSFPESAPQDTQTIAVKSRKRASTGSAISSASDTFPSPVVVFSNSSLDNRKDILNFLKAHGGKKLDSVTAPNVNYLVVGTGALKRTSKLTLAVALGKTVVTDKWLLECKDSNQILDPALYLPSDPHAEAEWKVDLPTALTRGKDSSLRTLFSNTTIYITPALLGLLKTHGQEAEYLEILKVAGAGNVKRPPRGVKCEDSETVVLGLGLAEGEKDWEGLKEGNWTIYKKEWVALSVLRGEVLRGKEWEVAGEEESQASEEGKGRRGRRR